MDGGTVLVAIAGIGGTLAAPLLASRRVERQEMRAYRRTLYVDLLWRSYALQRIAANSAGHFDTPLEDPAAATDGLGRVTAGVRLVGSRAVIDQMEVVGEANDKFWKRYQTASGRPDDLLMPGYRIALEHSAVELYGAIDELEEIMRTELTR